ncbi:30S ribosomal protein S13 [candidate division WWE3 bacterium]|uniref:Small ribosomal subunit protein uS13 n=1 Tax=candidate division WWE3 bacterium TaxID=2053526 RepID=A0A955LW87_UNCKA|nr:30S ribosomal protein S13 [candidate division WWE3 bacterium]
MARIVGVDIPDNKKIGFALVYIKGIGRTSALDILQRAQVDPEIRTKNLSEDDIARIAKLIDKNYKVEGELRREVRDNIKRLIEIGSYRGTRHKKNLPARGQRTNHNARTAKGPKKTVSGVSVRKAVSKT